MTLDEAYLELLRPLVQQLVREEVKKAQLELRWLPAAEAALRLGCSEDAVRKRVRRGTLPGRAHGRRVFVDMRAAERQLDQSDP